MKILILAPLERKITKNITSARPRLVFELAKGLIERGHKVTVIGTKDSKIKGARIIPAINKGFYELCNLNDAPTGLMYAWSSFLIKQAKLAEDLSKNFDVIHSHVKPEFIPFLAKLKCPMITTLHLPIRQALDEMLYLFKDQKVITPSEAAKKLAKKGKVYQIVHHGVDTNLYSFCGQKQDYLLWIGRLGMGKDKKGNFKDEKGVKWAIKLAEETNSKLIMAGNVESKEFFAKEVKPHLSKNIIWKSKLSFEQPLTKKQVAKLMQKAKALLMTTQLPETFGLVLAEAMSCGTPVIGFNIGAVGELIENGKTGFTIKPNNMEELKKALKNIDKIKPEDCRKHIEDNFSLEKMVENYEKVYKKIINK